MKRYQFRLEAVLKVRKMHEETCRNQLGVLMVERQRMLDLVAKLERDIQITYEAQQVALATGMRAAHVAHFPFEVEGMEAHIKQVKQQQAALEERIELKRQELTEKRAELKAVESLKEKDFAAWKKAANKEIDQKVEEMVQLWGEGLKAQKEGR